MLRPDFLLIGESDAKAGALVESVYETVCANDPPVRRMNFVNAELTKISVNTYVTTKIRTQICSPTFATGSGS